MKWWFAFWDGLNIRKLIVIVLMSLLAYSMLNHAEIDGTIKDLTLMAISYYLGYSNGPVGPKNGGGETCT